ncbi:hypothetical protein BJX66DRAFT_316884 [Aspergillus keveii]|uniref:Uncharacterized protein n=1 Tax=Aspergillus keveii TaxID=714993 RepID=A0ABR4FLY2_9EURO
MLVMLHVVGVPCRSHPPSPSLFAGFCASSFCCIVSTIRNAAFLRSVLAAKHRDRARSFFLSLLLRLFNSKVLNRTFLALTSTAGAGRRACGDQASARTPRRVFHCGRDPGVAPLVSRGLSSTSRPAPPSPRRSLRRASCPSSAFCGWPAFGQRCVGTIAPLRISRLTAVSIRRGCVLVRLRHGAGCCLGFLFVVLGPLGRRSAAFSLSSFLLS